MKPRPVKGTVTTRTFEIPVCRECGYAIDDTGLCSDKCSCDGGNHSKVILAQYERTDKFLGDKFA